MTEFSTSDILLCWTSCSSSLAQFRCWRTFKRCASVGIPDSVLIVLWEYKYCGVLGDCCIGNNIVSPLLSFAFASFANRTWTLEVGCKVSLVFVHFSFTIIGYLGKNNDKERKKKRIKENKRNRQLWATSFNSWRSEKKGL